MDTKRNHLKSNHIRNSLDSLTGLTDEFGAAVPLLLRFPNNIVILKSFRTQAN